ncbi:hypothetical protein CCACVL1_05766 [Corchorus capsularis]|uniref:RING-type E3 ubiquitin transferase n=1 Tax=Corchorus capsularis TaxID=210143 RepID=A0A1R3JJ26_COCAP|nr:hypothetical protein CCACVL1_05766 [Corchorus capsularis]
MEKKEIVEAEDELVLPPPPTLNVGIAINGNRKSKYVVSWALDKFIPEENIMFKLLHVRPKITTVPTPMGNSLPISQVRDDVADAYKKEVEWRTNEMLLPYKKMCAQRKVQVDLLVIESDDVANAIAEEVTKGSITKLVIGASSRGIFTRKLKKNSLSSRISVCTPSFCTVYAVSKGKLSSIRPSDLETNGSSKDDCSEASFSSKSSTSYTSSSQTDSGSMASYATFCSPSLPMQRFQALSTVNQTYLHSRTSSLEISQSRSPDIHHSRFQSLDVMGGKDEMSSNPSSSETTRQVLSRNSSGRSFQSDQQSWLSDQISTSDYSSSECQVAFAFYLLKYIYLCMQVNINFELEKLRTELRHLRGMYAIAQSETIDASRKLSTLSKRRLEEAIKLKEISSKEEEAKQLARQEKEKYEAARSEAEHVKECADREASQKREAEMKASHDAKEKEMLENILAGSIEQYQKFAWEEIVLATSSFSEDLRVGMGAYGTVYKCMLHHTAVAVKILHSTENSRTKQFQQELDILSKIRHPHLLLLLGACPDHGCLVYEYMENGSLEDRLLRKNNTQPIPWFDRYRIAWEVASALVFLHNSKPEPIIHRDLKPANILLDQNLVSKIGDVGLSMMLTGDPSSTSTMFKDTGPVGTLCYIDPEYQRTGLISPKSDVYAFGMVILQLLTAKPAIALTHVVETAIDDNNLAGILDSDAGNWPVEETKELVMLGLSCAELRRRDRPGLKDQVLPILERMKEVANRARISISTVRSAPPNHFICPILKDVMDDPCVAADGYSYDRKAIEKWLANNDNSPMTNLPLSNKILLPNYTLLSAIVEWKSRKQPLIIQYPEDIESQFKEFDEEVKLQCTSWRFSVETNNLSPWKTIPVECGAYVKDYMMGRGYKLDLERVSNEAGVYAKSVELNGDGKDVWVFDIDETLLSNLPYYAEHGYGLEAFDPVQFDKWVSSGIAPAIEPSLKLYEKVLDLGFKVFLLTGRSEEQRSITVENLTRVGFRSWDKLILRDSEDHGKLAKIFKSEKRSKMVEEGYRILGNSGDQWSDLLGSCPAIRSFKLPNPMYYIP